MVQGKKVKRSIVASIWAVCGSNNGIGELVYVTQLPETDDFEVTEYAVKTKNGFRNAILKKLYISHKVATSQ